MAPGLDALLGRALGVLRDEDRALGKIAGLDVEAPGSSDPAPLVSGLARAEGPARTLLAGAALLAGTARARRKERAGRAEPEPRHGLRRDGAMRALRLEEDGARRAAWAEALERADDAGRPAAIEVVRALRSGLDALGEGRVAALALAGGTTLDVGQGAERVLALTEDPWRELWRPRLSAVSGPAPRGRAELAAALRAGTCDRVLPLADRAGIASRWAPKVGLELPSVGPLPSPAAAGPSPRVLAPDPLARPRVGFAPAPDTHGVLELAEVVGHLVAQPVRTREPSVAALRLGASRIAAPLGATLARRLPLAPAFLLREAAVDRGAVAACLRELLLVELVQIRSAALHALALLASLDQEGGLGERIAELHARALGVPRSPALAPLVVVEAFESAAPARLEACLAEPALEARLVTEHDEDWFRNPRAGASIERGVALAAALGAAEGNERTASLALRLSELDARLRRWWRDAGA